MVAERNVATLADVEDQVDFAMLYDCQGLVTIEDKIAFLAKNLGIIATRCEQEESPEDELLGLEEFALLHPWYCRSQG
jgi:hypothetical protein